MPKSIRMSNNTSITKVSVWNNQFTMVNFFQKGAKNMYLNRTIPLRYYNLTFHNCYQTLENLPFLTKLLPYFPQLLPNLAKFLPFFSTYYLNFCNYYQTLQNFCHFYPNYSHMPQNYPQFLPNLAKFLSLSDYLSGALIYML